MWHHQWWPYWHCDATMWSSPSGNFSHESHRWLIMFCLSQQFELSVMWPQRNMTSQSKKTLLLLQSPDDYNLMWILTDVLSVVLITITFTFHWWISSTATVTSYENYDFFFIIIITVFFPSGGESRNCLWVPETKSHQTTALTGKSKQVKTQWNYL